MVNVFKLKAPIF